MRWAAATAEELAVEAEVAAETVVSGEVVVGGTVLGEGGMAVVPEALVAAAEVAAPAIAETTTVIVGGTAVEGTLVTAGVVETLATTGAVTTGEALFVGGLLTPVGWVVLGVIVVGVGVGATVYVLTRPESSAPAVPRPSPGVGKGSMAPAPRHAPGAPGGSPVLEPGTPTPVLAPGTDGMGPMLEPDLVTPIVAPPGAAPESMSLAVPRQVPVTEPDQEWWPEISAVAPDWGQKGAHIQVEAIEIAVRPMGGGIAYRPVFSRDVKTEAAQRAFDNAVEVAEEAMDMLGFRQRLYNACVRAIELLRTGNDMARARAAELRFLTHELMRRGV
jgi:hypothetical protein